ncbi:MAG TPA: cyclic nucleotide-binding domain-containing protein [Thermoanaerobaculia bacterium]|nr:cyclic nucleotide-binding domain-containing protein [Thermoanaerobaculia bacterium]
MDDVNFLRGVTLFCDLEPNDLEQLRKSFQITRFGAGDVILEQGKANRALHVVRSGRITVSRQIEEGEVPLCDLVAGQSFGELSIIEDGVATARLHAITETEVMSIAMGDLAAFLRGRPDAAAKFWREVALELRRRLVSTNDVVTTYFEMNRALIDNPTFRQAYAMCSR